MVVRERFTSPLGSTPAMSLKRQAIWSVVVFLIVSVFVVGVRPMVQPDEPRYGIIAAEMVESGEWFALRMAGFHYYEKPPMGYWMIAASIQLFGENAFAIRLPSAIAAGLSALAAWLIAVRITGRRAMGPLAFIVQATTIGPMIMGSVANLDSMFSAWISLCMVSFYAACTSIGRKRIGWLALAGAASGFAFLTKGLLGFAIPAVAALAFLAWERRWWDMLRLPWIPLASAAVIVAPIAILLHRSEPRFWEYFIVVEHFRRFANPDSNQHGEPWWFLIVLLPVGGVMWTLTWSRAIRGLFLAKGASMRSGMRFAIAWIIAPLVLLSISAGKMPSYIAPLFVPIAVLVTIGLVSAHERLIMEPLIVRRIGRWILRVLALGAIAAIFTGTDWMGVPVIWSTSPTLHWIVIAFVFLLWAEIDRWSWRAADATTWLMRSATAPVALLAAIPFLFPDGYVLQTQIPWRALEANQQVLRESSQLYTTAQLGHCVTWVTGRRDTLIFGYASEFDNELDLPQDDARLVKRDELIARIRSSTAGGIAVVASANDAATLIASPGIPAPTTNYVRGDIAILSWGEKQAK